MKVSVIIPCYKQAHFLRCCIGSLQAQTHPVWEAIIVNDGSPDDTALIAEALCREDARVRLISQDNGGLSAARNAGLRAATGEFVQLLDADDWIHPNKFAEQLSRASALPSDHVTYTDYQHCSQDRTALDEPGLRLDHRIDPVRPVVDVARRWEHQLSVPIHALLAPTNLILELGEPFDVSLPNHEDFDFWMRLLPRTGGISFVDQRLAFYRVTHGSMSRNADRMWLGFDLAIKKQLKLNRSDPDLVLSLRRLRYKNNLYHELGFGRIGRAISRTRLTSVLPWRLSQFLKSGAVSPP